jgi:hypothetical protein
MHKQILKMYIQDDMTEFQISKVLNKSLSSVKSSTKISMDILYAALCKFYTENTDFIPDLEIYKSNLYFGRMTLKNYIRKLCDDEVFKIE